MIAETFRIGEAISFGWDRFRANAGFLLLLGLVLGFLLLVANGLQRAAVAAPPAFAVVSLLVLAINAFISFVFVTAALEIEKFGSVSLDDLGHHLPRFFQYFIGYLLFFLALMIGYALLIVPGIYLSVKLFFYMFLVVDKKMSGVDALKLSYEMTRGHFGHLLCFLLSLFVINIAGLMLFGIGVLLTVPLTFIAAAYVYRKLAEKSLP